MPLKIRCTGSPQNSSRRFIIRALRFYLGYLLKNNPSSLEGLSIHLVFTDTKRDLGVTYWLDRPDRSKKFRIELLHNMSELKTLAVLAHECVHVKQYATGQLRDYKNDDGLVRWMGEVHVHDEDSPDYWFSPWELEAFGMQEGLYALFIEDHNSRK